ncbi:hypothetical protein [Bartonella taylorii]|uniref:Uncharacterized protein n=1 Tax=Bartonella taylorii TaxID=33046 RepID=A0A9Q9DLL3_BARTA|nr:hypothetical protein [Bartonella taylorii]USP02244.1 hypothetical protein LAJ60_04995 [Bartonella taylorii]
MNSICTQDNLTSIVASTTFQKARKRQIWCIKIVLRQALHLSASLPNNSFFCASSAQFPRRWKQRLVNLLNKRGSDIMIVESGY